LYKPQVGEFSRLDSLNVGNYFTPPYYEGKGNIYRLYRILEFDEYKVLTQPISDYGGNIYFPRTQWVYVGASAIVGEYDEATEG